MGNKGQFAWAAAPTRCVSLCYSQFSLLLRIHLANSNFYHLLFFGLINVIIITGKVGQFAWAAAPPCCVLIDLNFPCYQGLILQLAKDGKLFYHFLFLMGSKSGVACLHGRLLHLIS